MAKEKGQKLRQPAAFQALNTYYSIDRQKLKEKKTRQPKVVVYVFPDSKWGAPQMARPDRNYKLPIV